MTMLKSERGNVSPFIVMDVMERARQLEAQGRHIIHMEVGQPSTPAPHSARHAVAQTMAGSDALGYTVALGRPDLRGRISDLYQQWYGLDLDPERVVVTAGSSAAFSLTFCALFDNGARIGIGAPGYPSYRQILKSLGYQAVDIPTQREHGFKPQPSDLGQYGLNGLLVASPSNPTGTMLSHAELEPLMMACDDQNVSFISDEIYHGLEYSKKSVSALEISDNCYVINSFSKYFSMTGWRIGWMIVPPDHIRHVERIAQNMFICAPHSSQLAALHAFDGTDELEANLHVYAANRTYLLNELPRIGLAEFASPDGGFYFYIDVSAYTQDSLQFCTRALEHAGVAITPGLDFDPLRGHSTIRISYARSHDDIVEGCARLKQFIQGWQI